MKAITRDVYGGPEVLTWAEVQRREPRVGEVLLEVRAASINAADLHLLRGEPFPARFAFGLRRPKHRVLGADVAGRVIAVGKGVRRLQAGDAVFGDMSGHGFGAFAEEAVVPEEALARVPAGVIFEHAAAVPMAAVTALQALRDKGRLAAGQHVLVTGASGGVGSFALQLAKAGGARVTAVTSTPHVEAIRSLGADEVIDRHEENFRTRRGRFDLVIETAGHDRVREAMRVVKAGGRYVFVGGGDGATAIAALRGKAMLAKPNRKDLEVVAERLASGAVRPFVGATYPLSRGIEAIRAFEDGSTYGKVVLSVGEPVAA